ncbi:MAG: helix-hairpin-helix domain-containing protein, partial [Solirubrobacteraceae bacterium]
MPERFDAEVTIRRRRFVNDENGFAVLDAEHDGGEIVLVGPLIHLEERERAHVIGVLVSDSRYGEQVKVSEAIPLGPDDRAGVIAYLRRVKNIGHKRAEALVTRLGEERVLDAIDRDPVAAFRLVGLNAHRASAAAACWNDLRTTRRLHMLLAPHGLAYLVKRLSDEYGAIALRVVTENPYELTRVYGAGFKVADRIALAGPGDPLRGEGPPGRTAAALLYALSEAESRGGSTCLPLARLLGAAAELLGHPAPEAAVELLVEDGDLVRDGDWVYRTATWELERELAARVREMIGGRRAGGRLKPVKLGAVGGGGDGRLSLTAEQ